MPKSSACIVLCRPGIGNFANRASQTPVSRTDLVAVREGPLFHDYFRVPMRLGAFARAWRSIPQPIRGPRDRGRLLLAWFARPVYEFELAYRNGRSAARRTHRLPEGREAGLGSQSG